MTSRIGIGLPEYETVQATPTGKQSSLDLLEYCLLEIHRSRQAALQARSRKRREQMKKKAPKLYSKSPRRSRNINDDDDDDEEDYSSSSGSGKLGTVNEKHGSFQFEDDEENPLVDDIIDKNSPLKQQSEKHREISNVSQNHNSKIFKGSSFESIESQRHDHEASRIFAEFREDVVKWWKESSIRKQNVDARCEFADYLTDKYMCHKLDCLPTSHVVSAMRKDTSSIIEGLASHGNLPPDFIEKAFDITQQLSSSSSSTLKPTDGSNPMENSSVNSNSKKLLQPGNSKNLSISSKENSSEKPTITAAKKREEDEKKKMKDQYEAYMASSKNSSHHSASKTNASGGAATIKPAMTGGSNSTSLKSSAAMTNANSTTHGKSNNSEMERQYEELNDDIKALLSSLQSTKTSSTSKK